MRLFGPTLSSICNGAKSSSAQSQTPATAVTYGIEISKRGRRTQVIHETLYLACFAPTDAKRIFMDLHRELPPESAVAPLKSRSRRQDPS